MRNFLQFLPEEKKAGVEADYDTISATVQGFKIGVMVKNRTPYSSIEFIDNGAPFQFGGTLFFDAVPNDPSKTDFHIEFHADLNLMMKMMLGGKSARQWTGWWTVSWRCPRAGCLRVSMRRRSGR